MNNRNTIGIDLGDKSHQICVLNPEGGVLREEAIPATAAALEKTFAAIPPALVAIEAGTHSPWVARLLEMHGHEVLVANPRKLPAISASIAKTDRRDAQMLARIARFDPQLLSPIRHRGRQAQAHLAILKSRDALVKARTALINHARGTVKAVGERLPACSAESFHKKAGGEIPGDLRPALDAVLETIGGLTARIKKMDAEIEAVACERYPETARLRAVRGVGPLTALGFVLTIEEPSRFAKSRDVPAYLGLVPRRDQSGEVDKQLRITKAGDVFLRRLLISCAHYTLGPFGGDSAVRRWRLTLCERGGKNAKKRAVVAVARKWAVVLHSLWKRGADYEPFYEPAARRKRLEPGGARGGSPERATARERRGQRAGRPRAA